LESGQALAFGFRLVAIDGAVVEIAMRGRCVPAAVGRRPTRLCGTLAEIAHQPLASTPQPNACEVAQTAISELPGAAAFVVDRQLRYVLAQGQALREAGLHCTRFVGRTLAETLPAEVLAEHEADYRRALEGQTFTREHRMAERHFVTHGVPLRGRDEQVWGALAFSCDVTAFKQAQEALQRSEALLSAVLDALSVGVIIADADGRIVRDNAANRQLWGVPPHTSSW
jgi:PAS domain S-box-containing protein